MMRPAVSFVSGFLDARLGSGTGVGVVVLYSTT